MENSSWNHHFGKQSRLLLFSAMLWSYFAPLSLFGTSTGLAACLDINNLDLQFSLYLEPKRLPGVLVLRACSTRTIWNPNPMCQGNGLVGDICSTWPPWIRRLCTSPDTPLNTRGTILMPITSARVQEFEAYGLLPTFPTTPGGIYTTFLAPPQLMLP